MSKLGREGGRKQEKRCKKKRKGKIVGTRGRGEKEKEGDKEQRKLGRKKDGRTNFLAFSFLPLLLLSLFSLSFLLSFLRFAFLLPSVAPVSLLPEKRKPKCKK